MDRNRIRMTEKRKRNRTYKNGKEREINVNNRIEITSKSLFSFVICHI